MLATYSHPGESMEYTPGTAVASGDVIVIGDTIAIAVRPIPANELGAVQVVGVFKMPKAVLSTSAIAIGVKVYWDAGAEVVTTTASSHKVAGWTHAAAAATDPTIFVKLSRV